MREVYEKMAGKLRQHTTNPVYVLGGTRVTPLHLALNFEENWALASMGFKRARGIILTVLEKPAAEQGYSVAVTREGDKIAPQETAALIALIRRPVKNEAEQRTVRAELQRLGKIKITLKPLPKK
ncbi:MAG: hypothetical protein V1834_04440 [Candidatus Micrarchaeota archaeon]